MSSWPRRGVPLVVSAPSGAGKTTLCHRLIERLGGVEFSVSHTTRPPRGREQTGVDYHFVDDAEFDRLIAADAFLEWAPVHARRYGTARAEAERRLPRGVDVLFDIDVQGGRQIAARVPDAVLVFILPPSLSELERRLRGRGSDSEEQVQRRLAVATAEIEAAAGLYSHWLVNDDLEQATAELTAVLRAERTKRLDQRALITTILQR